MAINKSERMNQEAFERLREKLEPFSARKIEVARLVLVDGLTQTQAGERHGLSKQNVSALFKRIREIRANAPDGWVLLNIYVPPELATELLHRVERLKQDPEFSRTRK